MSFIINQNFDLKSPQFNFARDYYENLDALKAACGNDWNDYSSFPNHFVTNVGGTLYQYTESNSKNSDTGKWRKLEDDFGNYSLNLNTGISKPLYELVLKKGNTNVSRIDFPIATPDVNSGGVIVLGNKGLLSSADKLKLDNLAADAANTYVAKSEIQTLSDEEINSLWAKD